MPVYNGSETLARAISSLQSQVFLNWELIAIDDGSTDSTKLLLLGWSREDARIRVLHSAEIRGPAASRNLGIGLAKGDMVTYLDCDDEYYPDFLEHVNRLSGRADVLVFGYDCRADGDDAPPMDTWDPINYRHLFFAVQKVLLALPYCPISPTSITAPGDLDLLELLAQSDFKCQVFGAVRSRPCGVRPCGVRPIS